MTPALVFLCEVCEFLEDIYLVDTWERLFSMDFFLEMFQKFQKIFKSTSEKILLVYVIHNEILKGQVV